MVCTQIKALLKHEIRDYQGQLEQRKKYFDNITGEDVWIYLVERDFQKRFFQDWAEHEKQEFCSSCKDYRICKGIEASINNGNNNPKKK